MDIKEKGTVTFEVLISTTNRENLDFLYPMFINNDLNTVNILIINQTSPNKILKSTKENIRVINSFDKGLSRSRNLAIANAKGEICLIADDDEVFVKGFDQIIITSFKKHKDSSIIRFKIKTPEGGFLKKYPKKIIQKISALQILNTSSIEIAFRKLDILNYKLRFNEHFGLGGLFKLGEENLFLYDAKSTGLGMLFFPETIASHPKLSTISKVNLKDRYLAQGAVFHYLFGKKMYMWLLIKMFYDFKQGKLEFYNFKNAIAHAIQGKKMFLNLGK